MPDLFISYSRKDQPFVQKLHTALMLQNRSVWVDWQDILPTEKWWQAIQAGITASNAFIFVISPDSLRSKVCGQEVEYAIQHHKRLVPILYRDPQEIDPHPAMSAHNWIFMRDTDDFDKGVQILLRAIDTDIKYVRNHTRLLTRALEWQQEGEDPSFLLRGKDLNQAELWLQQAAQKQPGPTELQVQYITTSRKSPFYKPKLRTVIPAAVGVACLTVGLRLLGLLQPLELAAYDHLMRLRPSEPRDSRLALVQIDDRDITTYRKKYGLAKGSLADAALVDLLQKLNQGQPALIGLDLYRDFSATPALANLLQQNQQLVGVCKLSYGDIPGVEPAPELKNQVSQRVGFSDFVQDGDQDQIYVRRSALVQNPDPEFCNTDAAFSLQVVRQYLAQRGVPYHHPYDAKGNPQGVMRLGQASLPRLAPLSGGYQNLGDWWQEVMTELQRQQPTTTPAEATGNSTPAGYFSGYQVMLNYRTHAGRLEKFAPTFSLQQVLSPDFSIDQLKGRIILVGYNSRSGAKDFSLTPYGQVPGVVVQGQMVSQLLSYSLDQRPLIWWWPTGVDMLWIGSWAILGGLLVWRIQRPSRLLPALGAGLAGLYLGCYGTLVFSGGWIPLVPAAIALVGSSGLVMGLTEWLNGKTDRKLKQTKSPL